MSNQYRILTFVPHIVILAHPGWLALVRATMVHTDRECVWTYERMMERTAKLR